MPFFEGPQPVDSAAGEWPAESSSGAVSENKSDQKRSTRNLRESDAGLTESSQGLMASNRALMDSDLEIQESDRALAESPHRSMGAKESLLRSDQVLRESDHTLRETDQNLRETDEDLREANQNLREARQALLEGDEHFRLLVDSVVDYAIYMLDPEGRVVTWNVGAERSKGYKAEEILGQNYSLFFTPEDVEAGLPAQELAVAAREGHYETQAWRLRKDGTRFWANVTLTAIRGAEGELLGFAKITRDMTAQKAAEEAAQQHNAQLERYRIIVENVSEYGICTMDAEGLITSWGTAASEALGYTPEDMLGRHYSILATEDDRLAGLPQMELEEAARTGRSERDSWKHRKDGSLFWGTGTLASLRDETGKVTGFVRIGRDMTRQKRAEEALHELNRQLQCYRIVVENATEYAIYTMDVEGRIDSCGPGALKMCGYSAEEVLGRDYSITFTEAEIQAGEPQRQLEEAARTGNCSTEGWRVRRDGSKWWASGVLTAVHNENGEVTGYVRVARDMTEQKRLEESQTRMSAELEIRVAERTRELEATVAELRRKNVEVEAFVHIVSHDLRAPLVNVKGFVRELELSGKHLREVILACPNWKQCWAGVQPVLDVEIGGALQYISASTTKFERLITALLSLSRQGRQVYQSVRLNVWELATNAVASFQQMITEAGATVEVGALPAVTADATALGQVFSNLIGNALKYRSPDRPLKIELGGQVEAGMVHYWVRDNGLGIPEFGKAKLFQVFQRFHREQAEGEGMGLAIAHRIVERHGGKIWAESREGEGTTFHFSLANSPFPPSPGGAQ
jgi:PAS domain S-box-containing protein